jgi:RimJ/RimL family protein N-acetyltransferase
MSVNRHDEGHSDLHRELHRAERFVIRRFREDDLAAHVANRNDPTTAEFQSWALPYPTEKAQQSIAEFMALGGPTDDKWYSFVIADPMTDEMIGDVVVHLEWGGRAAMIGYNVAAPHRGRGIATGATYWLIQHLFDDLNVQRIHASLHPDNTASMMVLERLGFIYEGTARQAYWVEATCTDDPQFGLLRSDWDTWNARLRSAPARVELVEVTPANRDELFSLKTHRSQERFISPLGKSAADALVPDPDDNGGPLVPWLRAVVADGDTVGFVMMAEPTETNPYPFLWRLLIDRMHQRRGIGRQVLDLLADHYRAAGHDRLLVSWKPGKGSPEPMYLKYGFVLTGEEEDGEVFGAVTI